MLKLQFVRFLLVGVLNTAFGYGCFAVLLHFGVHYTAAMLLATVAGVLFNFKTTGALVFHSHDNRLIFRFIGTYVIVYLTNIAGIAVFSRSGLGPAASGAVMMPVTAVLAFLLNRKLVFRHE